MRISKEKAAENRDALIQAASRLIRERGIDGVGVAEISKAAGLTHGALYAHFRSKEELALAALAHGLEETCAALGAAGADGVAGLGSFLDGFLSPSTRDDYAGSCPIAASASEIGRQERAISACFSEKYLEMVRAIERGMGTDGNSQARAMIIVAALVGVQAVARGAAKGDPALSEEVLRAARQVIGQAIATPSHGAPQ